MLLKQEKAILVLQDGTVFEGSSFGAPAEALGEVVFNTSMTGYQEILTDPSYKGQIVTMTYPMMGNYGVNDMDVESAKPQVEGFIVKEYTPDYSNFRAKGSLGDYLKQHGIVAIEGIDTRALVRHIRDQGAMPGLISTTDFDVRQLQKKAKELPTMDGQDLVKSVSCTKPYQWKKGFPNLGWEEKGRPRSRSLTHRVMAYDFGIKQSILRHLVEQGCEVTVVPASTPFKEVLEQAPDGVFLSNGPGDPAAVSYAIENVRGLIGQVPLFGICLGHQILGLALGGKTFKLKFGHRGGNQPVQHIPTGRVEITSQNHGFALEAKSLEKRAELTHLHLNDQTVSGFAQDKLGLFGVQYHPEASPGPHDSHYLFEKFRKLITS